MSRLKRYKAYSLDACMQAARRDFGPDALIHAVRTRREGFLLLGRRTVHELLAGPAEGVARIEAAGREPRAASLRGAAALRAYAGAAIAGTVIADATAPVVAPGESAGTAPGAMQEPQDPSESSHEMDQRRTRLLAQAMALRLERDREAQRLARANERAVQALARRDGSQDANDRDMLASAGAEARSGHDAAAACSPALESCARRFVLVSPDQPRIATSAVPAWAQLAGDLQALRALVERVLSAPSRGADRRVAEEYLASPAPWSEAIDAARVGAPLAGFYATLIGHAMARDLAQRIIEEALDSLAPHERDDPHAARHAVRARVAALLPPCTGASIADRAGTGRGARPHVVSLVGPTGTGKTTTVAKLAADYALRGGRRVGLITTDTFRIGAVDQLRTYADIVGLPLHVAENADGVRRACEALSDRDVILVDTAGRGHADRERVDELGGLLRAASPDETHLVLSSTAGERTLMAEAAAFASVGVDRVVVAKLDEAVGFGVLIGALARIGRPLSWLTTGQQVPDDLEPAQADRLAELVLGGETA